MQQEKQKALEVEARKQVNRKKALLTRVQEIIENIQVRNLSCFQLWLWNHEVSIDDNILETYLHLLVSYQYALLFCLRSFIICDVSFQLLQRKFTRSLVVPSTWVRGSLDNGALHWM